MTARGQVLIKLGPGEIFGEISFLDSGDAGAAASVLAEDEVSGDRGWGGWGGWGPGRLSIQCSSSKQKLDNRAMVAILQLLRDDEVSNKLGSRAMASAWFVLCWHNL